MMRKAIIFDLDDTLVVEEASADAAFQAACKTAAKRSDVDPKQLQDNIRKACRSLWQNSPARSYCLNVGISSWEGLWAEFLGEDENLRILAEWASTYRQKAWQKALQMSGVHDTGALAGDLGNIFISRRRELHLVYDGVFSVLERFKKQYKLGLLTNGSPDLQRRKLEDSGLEKYFDHVVISGEVGFGKPDIRIYREILERLVTPPELAVMVGNSLRSDIAPALQLGMMAVWINRDGKSDDPSIVPSVEINNLNKLEKIMRFQA